MAGLSSLLSTARDALAAQSFGLSVTGQNITNASTPQYVRREALLETRALGHQTSGSVVAVGIRRVADAYADRAYFEANADRSAAAQYDAELASIEALFNDLKETGLSTSLNDIFKSFEQLAARPQDTTVRAELLDKLDVFASRVRETSDTLSAQRTNMVQRARDVTTQINERSREIADLNLQIVNAKQAGSDASDLIDRRNVKLLSLSDLIDVRTIENQDGSVMVRSSGTTLVEEHSARQLSIELDDEGKLMIMASHIGGGEVTTDISAFLSGGQLAGIKEARDVNIFDVSDRFDALVFDVATTINTEHRQGFGLDGSTGLNLFALTPSAAGAANAITVSLDVRGRPEGIAASNSLNNIPGGSTNAVALASLANTAVVGGKATPSQAYSDLVGSIGVARSTARATVELKENIFAQAESARESISGVSLDEEMVNLTKYQRAYEAAGKVIATVDELLQYLINTVKR